MLASLALGRRRLVGSALAPVRQLCAGGQILTRTFPSRPARQHERPSEERRPFQQKDRRRDDKLLARYHPAAPIETQMEAWISDWDAEQNALRVGITQLRPEVWGMPMRPDIVDRVVHWQRACRRKGRKREKSKAERSGGGAKPLPQKGTGKARQGSIRSPHFVGGGRAHPARPRDFSYSLNRKVVSLGVRVALSDKYARGALVLLESTNLELGKTQLLLEKLARLGIRPKLDKPGCGGHRVMIVGSNDVADKGQVLLKRAAQNVQVVDTSRTTHAP